MAMTLVSPWVRHYKKIEALFQEDSEVRVVYDNEDVVVKLYVDNDEKAMALEALMPEYVDFGSVIMDIIIVPSNKELAIKQYDRTRLYENAFSGNGAVEYIQHVTGIGNAPMTYIVFRNYVVQFFTDDLSDIHGICSTLYQDIATDVLKGETGVFYCTEILYADLVDMLMIRE